jgi:hypothetical protein
MGANTRKKFYEEWKSNIGKTQIGRKHSEETKTRMMISGSTEEARRKKSEGSKKSWEKNTEVF